MCPWNTEWFMDHNKSFEKVHSNRLIQTLWDKILGWKEIWIITRPDCKSLEILNKYKYLRKILNEITEYSQYFLGIQLDKMSSAWNYYNIIVGSNGLQRVRLLSSLLLAIILRKDFVISKQDIGNSWWDVIFCKSNNFMKRNNSLFISSRQ